MHPLMSGLYPSHSKILEEFSTQEVLSRLSEILTEDRKNRIQEILNQRSMNFIPIVENIYDRGNISAAMRSAEAFGFMNFFVVENKNDKFKSANRVTQGADKWLNIKEYHSPKECVGLLKSLGYQIFATHLEASQPLADMDFSKPSALVFGNEKDGVSSEMVDLVDGNVIIPMMGFSQSFNISVAAALSFYHVYRDRERAFGQTGDLTEIEIQQLSAHYYIQSIGLERAYQILNV